MLEPAQFTAALSTRAENEAMLSAMPPHLRARRDAAVSGPAVAVRATEHSPPRKLGDDVGMACARVPVY